jgi:hypothetical protein
MTPAPKGMTHAQLLRWKANNAPADSSPMAAEVYLELADQAEQLEALARTARIDRWVDRLFAVGTIAVLVWMQWPE